MIRFFRKEPKLVNSFYSRKKEELFKIRFSEVFALLNCLRIYAENRKHKNNFNDDLSSQFVEHVGFINVWAKALLEDEEILSKDAELFYATLLSQSNHWKVTELKVAYSSKIGKTSEKLLQTNRLNENDLKRIKSKIKKRLKLRQNESLSFYLSNFN